MSLSIAPVPTSTSSYSQLLGSPSVDARLNLSLDDLIKERKKEVKKEIQQKKRENVKKETTAVAKNVDHKNQQKKNVVNAQGEKRKAQMNKNRGLPGPVATQKQKGKENAGPNTANPKKMKRTNAKQAAASTPKVQVKQQKQQQKKNANKGNNQQTQASAVSKKNKSNSNNSNNSSNNNNNNNNKVQSKQKPQQQQQQQKKKPQQQQNQQKQNQQKQKQWNQPSLSPKQEKIRARLLFSAGVHKTSGREVTALSKGSKLQITLKRSKTDVRRVKKQQPSQQQHQQKQMKKLKPQAAKALLPGKTQTKTRKILAQNIMKKAKVSRKQTSKNGKFIVRKPVMVRKA